MNGVSAGAIHDLIDPAAISTLDDLELIARGVVEGFVHGLHTSPYVGFSIEFASHREYMPGDDLRYLNWKLFGRHDKLYVKQFDAETNLEMHVVLDVSGSMTAGEDKLTKLRYASMLAVSLAHLATKQRDAVGLTLFADRVIEHLKPRANPDQLMTILHTIARVQEHRPADSSRVLHEVAELMPRRGLVVVISDFYFEVEELLAGLSHIRHFGHDLLLFHVLEPLERNLEVTGSIRFRDLETREEIIVPAHEIGTGYRSAVSEWIHDVHHGCLSREIDHFVLLTNTPLQQALLDYFTKRSQMY